MTSWINVLPEVIDNAAVRTWATHKPATIVVDMEPKAVLGRSAAERMYPGYDIQFVVEPGNPIPYLKVSEAIAAEPKQGDPCVTAPPGTGMPCGCSFPCDNYLIMARNEGVYEA